MKKLMWVFLSFFLTVGLFAGSRINVDKLTPQQRKSFAENWLETGKTYKVLKKYKDARACFLFTTQIYPMGEAAKEARKLLKAMGKKVTYNPEKTYADYIKRANRAKDKKIQLNHLAMSQVIRKNADVLYRIAKLHFELGSKQKAADTLKEAVQAGYPSDKIEPELKAILTD